MFVATSHTRLDALRTTCARRALQPGTERAPAASPASQTPPALPRSPSAELKSAQGPITDASNGAKGDRALTGDGWGRGRRGRQGGAGQGAAGGWASQQHREGEYATKNRAVGGRVGVRTPGLVEIGAESGTRRRPARPQRVLRGQPQPQEGADWPPHTPCHQAERRGASARPDRAGRRP